MSKRKRAPETKTFNVPTSVLSHSEYQATVQRAHPNGRHTIRENIKFYVPNEPSSSKRPQEHGPLSATTSTENGLEANDDLFPPTDPLASEDVPSTVRREFVTLEHDSVLRAWSQQTDKFVDELMRLAGLRGCADSFCPSCPLTDRKPPLYRCSDCFGGVLVCSSCCVESHRANPFHRIQKWTGSFFKRTTLQELGLIIQLGHPFGEACKAPGLGPSAALVLHTNGFHPVTVRYCQCDRFHLAGDRVQQLLRLELYPATLTDPTTMCTFGLLNMFHLLTLISKINATDFYGTLERMTDNIGTGRSYDRLKPFLRCVREWRYLKMLVRSGRGYISNGTKVIGPGELCVPCLACPRPGFNIPDDWQSAPSGVKFIYTLMIALDANFRLKRRMVSNNLRDPALGSGQGYFVEDEAYREHVLKYANQKDISTCTGFAALEHANTRYTAGYATTGVVMCICARHGMILPNGVGDLQKGERYCNVDYVTSSALKIVWPILIPLLLSYDIICQWFLNWFTRMHEEHFPEHLRVPIDTKDVRTVIPKYHFNGHKEEDHNRYSLNLVIGVGRTDGEEIERNWFRHNATAASTREMGPGSRHDTLEDHFGWSNHVKSTSLGHFLKRKLALAKVEFIKYQDLFVEFMDGLQPANVAQWLKEAEDWEKDPANPDPYYVAPSGLTEAQIRAQLTEEEAAQSDDSPSHQVSPLTMMVEMLEIEDQQRRFRLRFPKVDTVRNPLHVAEIIEKRSNLRRRLRALREWQAVYMPPVGLHAATYHTAQTTVVSSADSVASRVSKLRNIATAVPPEAARGSEHEPVFFPHHLTVEELDLCHSGIAVMESRLRMGQMRSSLDKLRVQLHIKTRLLKFKAKNVRNQTSNTRFLGQIDTNEGRIRSHAEKYRAARAAYLELEGPGTWENTWRKLLSTDVRCLRDSRETPADETGTEGHREVAWIWQTGDRHESDEQAGIVPGIADALRGEFLRSRSRALRFKEEIMLLEEEQRRTLVSLEKYAQIWSAREREPSRSVSCPILRQGMQAYAARQAAIRLDLANMFRELWASAAVPAPTPREDIGREAETDADGIGLQRTFATEDDGLEVLS